MNTSWQEVNNKLIKEFEFDNFLAAIDFINQVAKVAQNMDHHPEIKNIYNKVTLTLSTHDAGDTVTDKDRQLAAFIDQLYVRK